MQRKGPEMKKIELIKLEIMAQNGTLNSYQNVFVLRQFSRLKFLRARAEPRGFHVLAVTYLVAQRGGALFSVIFRDK